jgi:hypothetical protein
VKLRLSSVSDLRFDFEGRIIAMDFDLFTVLSKRASSIYLLAKLKRQDGTVSHLTL